MVRLEWDVTGRLLEVTIRDDAPFDGTLAREVIARLEAFLKQQDRLLLLVDARALQRGTLDWTSLLSSFLLRNGDRLRIAVYGGGHRLDGLEGWSQSADLEVAAFSTRDEAGRWLIGGLPRGTSRV